MKTFMHLSPSLQHALLSFAACFILLIPVSVISQQKQTVSMTHDSHPVPPVARKEKHVTRIHGKELVDEYFWMRLSDEQKSADAPEAQTTAVVSYLQAENAYREAMTAHTAQFQEVLFEEMKGRIKQTDMSVPYLENGYYYITRYEEGKEYPIHSRKKGSLEATEEIMLDVNNLAATHAYYAVGGRAVSPDNTLLAYSEDTVSRRQYTIRFLHLASGKLLQDFIPNTTGGIVWGNDNKTVFYTLKDAALRS